MKHKTISRTPFTRSTISQFHLWEATREAQRQMQMPASVGDALPNSPAANMELK